MKVALLIFPLHYSHGCILQTFALYSKLKDFGYNVTILDRQPAKLPLYIVVIRGIKLLAKKLLKGYKGATFYRGWFPKSIMIEQQSFINGFSHDIISINSTEELKKEVEEGQFDAIIVGSDQTWRPCYIPNVMDYWLDFISDKRLNKVAYAPSFGVDSWEYSDSQTKRCRELATQFNRISVREVSGVKLCKDHIGADVFHVLDPTMLWTESFYKPYASMHPMPSGGCHCYFLDDSNEKKRIAETVASNNGLEVRYINTHTEDEMSPIKDRIAPSIEKWLAGFMYGDFIVVDSFHAMVFSIIFQKPFIVIGNCERGLARFESLLGDLGLEERLITNINDVSKVLANNICWDNVNEKLNTLRNNSSNFLVEALEN